MGSCSSHEDKVIVGKSVNDLERQLVKLREQLEERFRDMPEYDGDKYRGEGIKRMQGYKFNKPIDDLYKLREDFWGSKPQTKTTWKYLRQACLMDNGIYIVI
jgi:hypothetical protein